MYCAFPTVRFPFGTTAIVGALSILMSVPVSAQSPDTLPAGSRVRVTAPAVGVDRIVGTMAGSFGDSLSLVRSSTGDTMTVSRAAIWTEEWEDVAIRSVQAAPAPGAPARSSVGLRLKL